MAHKWASMVRIHHLRHHVLIQQRGGNWWRRQWAHWRELVLTLASCEQSLFRTRHIETGSERVTRQVGRCVNSLGPFKPPPWRRTRTWQSSRTRWHGAPKLIVTPSFCPHSTEGKQQVAAAVGATKLAVRDAPSWWLHPMCCVRLRALLWYAIRRRRGNQRAFAPRWDPAAAADGVLVGCCPRAVMGHADWRACHVGRVA